MHGCESLGFKYVSSSLSGSDLSRILHDPRSAVRRQNSLNSLGGLVSGSQSAGGLSSIPSALSRWTEESRVLDTVSLYDCVTACKPEVLTLLEAQREREMAERRRQEEERRSQEEAADTGEILRRAGS